MQPMQGEAAGIVAAAEALREMAASDQLLVELKATAAYGTSAFAAKDIAAGEAVLTEVPVLEFPATSSRLDVAALAELAAASAVAAGESLQLPERVSTEDVGVLDAFVASSESVRQEVLAMQSSVDGSSPLLESSRRAAEFLHSRGTFEGLGGETLQRVILLAKVNAYTFGKDRQALFSLGRFVAHSCSPNCLLVVERLASSGGAEQAMVRGAFRALRDIARGELLTTAYAPDDVLASARAQRQKYVLCHRGFRCACDLCRVGATVEDPFDGWPCPRCRPRGPDGSLADEHLAGCRAFSSSAGWRTECGACFADGTEEVMPDGAAELAKEVFLSIQGAAAAATAAARNTLLARVLKCFGDGHGTSQLLLRSVALRALAAARLPLAQTADQLARCHDFLVSAGWPLGMMPMHGLYKAVVARAQAEVKVKTAVPPAWPRLVRAAARCATLVEGEAAEVARLGKVVAGLVEAMAVR